MSSLLQLPPELTERILLFCSPRDVSWIAQTCWAFYNMIYKAEDQYLWRELFLSKPFDDLRSAVLAPGSKKLDLDWKTALSRREEAELVIRAGATGPQLLRALETCVTVLQTALPVQEDSEESSVNIYWLDGVLRSGKGKLATTIADPDTPPAVRQVYARLQASLALSHELERNVPQARIAARRRASRCFVYDLRRYKEDTMWGPYRRGEKGLEVDWEHVEHIVTVVGMKLHELPQLALHLYSKPTPDLTSTRAYSAPLTLERKPYDWAGISGTWRRFVCFMDYRDLFAFNFSLSNNGPRDPSFFDDDYQEAIRPVELRLEVIEPEDDEAVEQQTEYPTLNFKGWSHGVHNNDAVVEGSVSVLADGGVRWCFVTKYDGLTQWSAEGVQLGNICSAAGVVGIWTGAFHEDADPAGPFWMWKVSGDYSELRL